MGYPPTLTDRSRRLARILAVVALLCVGGVQILEAGHAHGISEPVAECLLCKTSPPAPLTGNVPALLAFFLLLLLPALQLAPQQQRSYCPRQTRGPPLHS
ncbi:hypothetical protein [Kineobactrum salinum]|uniref:DUF2946 domain-containing protein n=1 Tax=Kineobactrum salinum TaxID=2708301 RepID=A0A6C0U0M4_9GAMM|nr:hypothetical protein [Kineobactrum salinum]QIB65458.1 hypothetical protein G3T16_08635 [Kineobactrum salinum]